MSELPVEIAWLVLQQFEQLGIEYMLVGSVASSLQGVARSTLDLDVLARIAPAQARELLLRLGHEFYVSEAAVTEALGRVQPVHSFLHVSRRLTPRQRETLLEWIVPDARELLQSLCLGHLESQSMQRSRREHGEPKPLADRSKDAV